MVGRILLCLCFAVWLLPTPSHAAGGDVSGPGLFTGGMAYGIPIEVAPGRYVF